MSMILDRNCRVCGFDKLIKYIESRDNLVTGEYFTIQKCEQCGFLQTNPRPEDDNLGKYYQSEEYISHKDRSSGLVNWIYYRVRKYMFEKKLKVIRHLVKFENSIKPALLDYGCATGEFLSFAKSIGFDVYGYEPQQSVAKVAAGKNIPVFIDRNQLFLNTEFISRFEIVTLWHVLEHISDPGYVIEKLRTRIKDHGYLIIAVPHNGSFDAKVFRSNWAAWDVPRHLNHFNPDTLDHLVVGNGFKLKSVHSLPFDSFYISLMSDKSKFLFLHYLNSFFVGLFSNIVAFVSFKKVPYSSQFYVYQKL